MRCPVCIREGSQSTVWPRGPFVTTCMAYGGPYWDEDGNRHDHDPNYGGHPGFECSRGHQFGPASKPCPSCDYHAHPAWEKDACPKCGHVEHNGDPCKYMRSVKAGRNCLRLVCCECGVPQPAWEKV